MTVEVKCGRCEACGGQEVVAYDQQVVREANGTVRRTWQAVVECPSCRARRVYPAEHITDYHLELEVFADAEGGEPDASDDGGSVQPG